MKENARSKRDPEGTRKRILDAAVEEFRTGGLAGARVDCIARRAETNERMLYYYFGSKEGLFIAALEETFNAFITAQGDLQLQLDALDPEAALVRFAHFIWEYYESHPEIIRLINNENLYEAKHLKVSTAPSSLVPVVEALSAILRRGAAAGVFREDADPVRCYLSISALGYYVQSNRFTLQAAFGRDFTAQDEHERVTALHTEMLLAYFRVPLAEMKSRILG